MNRRSFVGIVSVVASTTLIACGDPLVAPELITGTRVLAARTETASNRNRAWVTPSEAASVRWLVTGPEGPVPLGWAFTACVALPISRGLPICAAPPFARSASTAISKDEPRFEFMVPNEVDLASAASIAIGGAFCASGTPALVAPGADLATTTCPDAAESPLLATFDVYTARDGRVNENPDFARVLVGLDDTEWLAGSQVDATTACSNESPGVPRVAADGGSHALTFAIPTDMSEPVERISEHSVAREALTLAHFVTDGDLERVYSDVNLQANPALVQVSWRAPATAAAGGKLVRFSFVLRDGRGGAAYIERAVCVVP